MWMSKTERSSGRHSVLLGSSRFSMLSVDNVCAFVFYPGNEGLTSDRLEFHWVLLSLHVFTFVFSWLTQPEGINPGQDLRNPCPFDLMIVWTLVRWTSEFYTWPFENRSWWLSTRTSETFATVSTPWKHSSSFWTSHVMEVLHNCNDAHSSLHRITYDDVSCLMKDTLQKSSNIFTWFFITSPPTPSPTIRPPETKIKTRLVCRV
jgi:hypothetical protein